MREQSICVITPNKDVYSETFIRAHIEQLPIRVHALYGYPLPESTGEGDSLYSYGLSQRILNNAGTKLFGYGNGWLQRRKLIQYLKRNQVKAVLAEYGHTGVAMMEVCQKAKIPLIVHFHGHDAYHNKILDHEGKKYPELFEKADALIVVSKDMYQQLLHLGAPSEKIYINPYGVKVSQFCGADPANAAPVFISVGRFVDKKAPHLTIMAFSQVLESSPKARLIMIGDGPLVEVCHQIVQALAITHSVEFRGACSHEQVAKEFKSARAFVQHSMRTSYGDSEGTPVAILEASAAGLPVVATRHAGIKDVILDGESGFLVEEGDVHAMARAMDQLVHDPALAAQLGQKGKTHIRNSYSMEMSITNLWNIIKMSWGEESSK